MWKAQLGHTPTTKRRISMSNVRVGQRSAMPKISFKDAIVTVDCRLSCRGLPGRRCFCGRGGICKQSATAYGWRYRMDFEATIQGCIGSNFGRESQVYRGCQAVLRALHFSQPRCTLLNQQYTAFSLSHGMFVI